MNLRNITEQLLNKTPPSDCFLKCHTKLHTVKCSRTWELDKTSDITTSDKTYYNPHNPVFSSFTGIYWVHKILKPCVFCATKDNQSTITDLFTITEEILNGKFLFLCSESLIKFTG